MRASPPICSWYRAGFRCLASNGEIRRYFGWLAYRSISSLSKTAPVQPAQFGKLESSSREFQPRGFSGRSSGTSVRGGVTRWTRLFSALLNSTIDNLSLVRPCPEQQDWHAGALLDRRNERLGFVGQIFEALDSFIAEVDVVSSVQSNGRWIVGPDCAKYDVPIKSRNTSNGGLDLRLGTVVIEPPPSANV